MQWLLESLSMANGCGDSHGCKYGCNGGLGESLSMAEDFCTGAWCPSAA